MIIRKAAEKDIPFLIKGILEIEAKGSSNTYNNLFSVDTATIEKYLTQFFLDEENLDTELSLNRFIIAEIDGNAAGFCTLIFTDAEYYRSKSEIFPVHLEKKDLEALIDNAKTLPDHRSVSENKHFIEYIYVDENFRKRGIAKKMIEHQTSKIDSPAVYINVFEDSTDVIRYYKSLGFEEWLRTEIDTPENRIYPSVRKVILTKKID